MGQSQWWQERRFPTRSRFILGLRLWDNPRSLFFQLTTTESTGTTTTEVVLVLVVEIPPTTITHTA